MEINDFFQAFLESFYKISLWQVGIAVVIATTVILLEPAFYANMQLFVSLH